MIEQEVELHRPFSTAELRPGKERQTEGDGGAVQGEQFVLEPEFVRSWGCAFAHGKGFIEEIPKQLPGPMGIGIKQG